MMANKEELLLEANLSVPEAPQPQKHSNEGTVHISETAENEGKYYIRTLSHPYFNLDICTMYLTQCVITILMPFRAFGAPNMHFWAIS